MENKKGYAEVTRLRKPNKFYNENIPESKTNPRYFILTEQQTIRNEMARAFQDIYNKQHNLNDTEKDIREFLDSGGDWAPYQEFLKRKIPEEMSNSMEGLLTDEELSVPKDEGLFIPRNRWVYSQSSENLLV